MAEPDDVVSESTTVSPLIGCEGRIEGSSLSVEEDGGGGGEIMVEVVGSDVFVDGVGGNWSGGLEKKVESVGGFESREVGDLGGQVQDSSLEETAGSLDEQTHVVAVEEKVSMRADEEGDVSGILHKNSGIETGIRGGSLEISASSCDQTEVVAERVLGMVNEDHLESGMVEEKCTKAVEGGGDALDEVALQRDGMLDEQVWNPGIGAASSSLGNSAVVEGVNDEDLSQKDQVPGGGAEKRNLNGSENHYISVAETICMGKVKDDAIYSNVESLNPQVEAAVGGVMNKEEILNPATDCSVSNNGKNLISCSVTKVADENVDYVEDQELKVKNVEGGSERETVETLSSCEQIKVLNGNEVSEMGINVLNSKSKVPIIDDMDGSAACSEDDKNMKCETTYGIADKDGHVCADLESSNKQAPVTEIDYVEDQELKVRNVEGGTERETTETLSSCEQIKVVNGNEVSAMDINVLNSKSEVPIIDDMDRSAICSEDDQNMKCETTYGIAGKDGHVCADLESSKKQAHVTEIEEGAVMDVEEVMNIEDEVTRVDAFDGSCSGKDQFLKVEESRENSMVLGDLEYSSKQVQITDRSGIAVTDEEIPTLNGETVMNGEKALVSKFDEVLNIPTVVGSEGKDGIAQGDGDGSGEQIKIGNQAESSVLDCQGIAQVPAYYTLDENISPFEKEEKSKVETLGKNTVEDPSVRVDVPIGDHVTSIQTCSDSLGDTATLQDEKQETAEQLADIHIHEVVGDQSMNAPTVDEPSALGVCAMVLSNTVVDSTATFEAAGNNISTNKESDSVSSSVSDFMCPLPDEPKNLKVHRINNDISVPNENQTVSICVSDMITSDEVVNPVAEGESYEVDEQVPDGQVFHESMVGSLVVDLGTCLNEQGKLKSLDESVEENVPLLVESQVIRNDTLALGSNGVGCALEEVSEQVELGLACSCIPNDCFDNIESHIVENSGFHQESSRSFCKNKAAGVCLFEPDKLVEYVRALAESPSAGADQLELVIAKSQLLAFNRLNSYCRLPEFQFCGGLLENNTDDSQLVEAIGHALDEQVVSSKERFKAGNSSSHKRKHNLKDSVYPWKKERSLSELAVDITSSADGEGGPDWKASSQLVSSSSGKKRKSIDFLSDGSKVQDRRISIYAAKVSTTVSPTPKPSFKVGECISRIANQLTGSPSILKSSSENFQKVDGSGDLPVAFGDPLHYSSLDEILSQLHLVALDPNKAYSFSTTIVTFFSAFRNSICLSQYSGRQNLFMGSLGGVKKKKPSHAIIGSPEEFEFDDPNDAYWTDRIIQNNSEEQPSGDSQNRLVIFQPVTFDPDKSLQLSRRSYSRKRYSYGNHEMALEYPTGAIGERKNDNSPTELILNFSEGDSIPSEMNLNKIFRRFGPLKESETEVDMETSRARVVFKRCSDAEVAFSSSGKFNIFGSMIVNYQLSYSPSFSFKTMPLVALEGQEDAT